MMLLYYIMITGGFFFFCVPRGSLNPRKYAAGQTYIKYLLLKPHDTTGVGRRGDRV